MTAKVPPPGTTCTAYYAMVDDDGRPSEMCGLPADHWPAPHSWEEVNPPTRPTSPLTIEQFDILRGPLNATRVATRTQSGRNLSYLEAWDVKAHLTRVFGYGGWSFDVLETRLVDVRAAEVGSNKTPGWEPIWYARGRLEVPQLECSYTEAAVGSFVGSVDLGGLHDNAVKQAASDALKRCAINLGTQFGLSLYDNGNRNDVVKGVLVRPQGWVAPVPADVDQRQANVDKALGASGE